MKPACFLLAACLLSAAGIQAQPLPVNAQTQEHYRRQINSIQPQLPLRLNRLLTLESASFDGGTLRFLYRLSATEEAGAAALEGMKEGTLQEYYLKVCTAVPPLQPVAEHHIVQDGSGKPQADWRHTPEMCRSGEAGQAAERKTFALKGRMIRKNVRLDENSVKDGVMTVAYTLTDRDFNDIATMLPYAVNTMHNQSAAIVCRPDGSLTAGLKSAIFILRDKNGKALPQVEITPADCAPQPAAPPESEKPRRKNKG